MLELQDICFEKDNKKILDHINLKIDKNKFYVITGPNGSGKSTLAKIIMGIIKPTSGKILFNGKDITNMESYERSHLGIGYAFQQAIYFKGFTVYDLLKIAIKKDITKQEACKILSKVGLCALEYIDREINSSLSGGELKRIEIATILALKPQLSIFDEPEAGIDLWSFNNLNMVFKNLQEESSGSTLVISHQEKILNMASVIVLMERGKIKAMGTKEKLEKALFTQNCCRKKMCDE